MSSTLKENKITKVCTNYKNTFKVNHNSRAKTKSDKTNIFGDGILLLLYVGFLCVLYNFF